MDYEAFVNGRKNLLIAPAGYGKTYTIIECLKHTLGKQLILTHTHAGISSIKEKINAQHKILSNRYQIETISSFAQKYVLSFYMGDDVPEQEDSKKFHNFILEKAIEIFESSSVKKILANTYQGLFVDEYQDCSKLQHNMIMKVSDILPIHALGDPLQGIFDFNGEAIDFDRDLSEFAIFSDLSIPYRWQQEGNNRFLGEKIKQFRSLLQQKKCLHLENDEKSGIKIISIAQNKKFYQYANLCRNELTNLVNDSTITSLLVITPPDIRIDTRARYKAYIDPSKQLTLLEAIDDKTFYDLAKSSDELISGVFEINNLFPAIKEKLLDRIFHKTELKTWFSDYGVKGKRSEPDKIKALKVKNIIDAFSSMQSRKNLYILLEELRKILKIQVARSEVFFSLVQSLKDIELTHVSVYESMKKHRNHIRTLGRKVHAKCIGTTLLTKGLEFDAIIILDAHEFKCHKHFYVALSRGCKKLIILTQKTSFNFF